MSHRILSSRMAVCALAAVLLTAGTTFADSSSPDADPLGTAVEKCGLKCERLADQTAWKVPFDAKEQGTLNVYVTYNDDKRQYALIFATVVHKTKDFEYSREVLEECMKINSDIPGFKFCLDYSHGDLDCQAELLMSTLTPESLKHHLSLVASMSQQHGPKLRGMAQ